MNSHANNEEIRSLLELIQQHRLDHALARCSALCDKYPHDAKTWFFLGVIHGQRADYDQSVSSLQRSIALDPLYDQAHHYLGTAFLRKGQLDEAVTYYERSINLNPRNIESYSCVCNILASTGQFEKALEISQSGVEKCPSNATIHCEHAKVLIELGRNDDANRHLQTACRLQPAFPEARYFLAALSGEHSAAASNQAHVAEMFDRHAEGFDRHLVEGLDYHVPEQLYESVRRHVGDTSAKLDILDLGCGTGLGGEVFRPMSRKLTGVDLSPKMIEKARARGIYDDLSVTEVNQYIEQSRNNYDLVLSADVFIYVGALDNVFRNTARILKPGGLFAFSVESVTAGNSFKMQTSGRYAHSNHYIMALAERYELAIVESSEVVVRQECFQPIAGRLFVLRKPV